GGMYLLPRIVRAFREQYPETEIIFEVDHTERLYESALQNVLDMAIVGGPTVDKRFGAEPICMDTVMLIASPAHPLARKGRITLEELAAQPCVLPQAGSRTRQLVEQRLKAAGITLNVIMQLPGTEAVKKAVEADLGVGFVSSFAIEHELALGDLAVLQIAGLQIHRNMELIYCTQKYFSPTAQRFRQFAHEFGATISPVGRKPRRDVSSPPQRASRE
ncbi:MAG: hypothetical protein EXQ59_06750, partial [Acidobacteria bacterium]|nr:hypothetical protein [Acidobacteriota bacterium]